MIQATENLHLGDLISRRVPFVVPKYQRAFAWDEEEVQEYIQDISDLYRARQRTPSSPMTHFFGGLVSVNKIAPNTYTGRVYDVVDGQQRLTTFMLTVAALVEGLENVATEAQIAGDTANMQAARSHADTTKNDYLDYKEVINGQIQTRVRLTLSRADAQFFEQLINNNANSRTQNQFLRDSHRRLQSAWKQIYRHVIADPILNNQNLTIDNKIERLLCLRSCITEDCYLIHIVSDNLSEAYRLFAVLNDRGKTLSDGDLLRSYSLESLEGFPVQQAQVEHAWDNILRYRDLEIDQFLRAYFPSFQGERAPKRDLADSFRKVFFNFSSTPLQQPHADAIMNRVAEMQDEAQTFAEISEGRWPFANSTVSAWERDRLSRLIKVLKHTVCIPLLMSAYRHLCEQEFADLVSLIERFSFRYITIVSAHAGKLSTIYNNHAKQIRTGPSIYNITTLRNELFSLQMNGASDALFEAGLGDKLVCGNSSARQIVRYFLTTLEDYIQWYKQGAAGNPRPDKTRVLDLGQITIEHIYPQNPVSPFVDPDLHPHRNTIGNLSFWGPGENSAASNSPFASKRSMYASSSIMLNRDLGQLQQWNKQEFENRTRRLINIAKKIFTA